jgi:photosystem II stability/assembly factor-like uncharacterized protein
MNDLTCRTARLWLQEPEILHPIDARHLDRHLAACPRCASYRHEQVRMDELLRAGLDTAAGPSVRAQVRSRLASGQARPTGIRGWEWIPTLKIGAFLAPVAVAAVFVALFLPQALQRRGAVTPVGAAWHLQRPHIAFPLTVDPVHPRHLLVGAWGQVYQSWNGGSSWNRAGTLPAGLIVRDVAVDATNPRHYLAAAMHSVYVSHDAGRHWKVTASGLRGAMNMFLLQSPHQPATYYVGPGVIWLSTDRGRTWRQDGLGRIFAPYGVQSLSIAQNGTLFAGIWDGGVAVSTDGGRTWKRQSDGLRKKVLDVSIGRKGRMWAATDRGSYLSTDSGHSWIRRSPHHAFATSVLDGGSFILVGTSGGLYRSTDAGHHWTFSERGLPLDPYIYSLVSVPGRPGVVYASLDGDGIFRSTDGGIHWRPAVTGLPIDLQEGRPQSVLFIRHGVLWLTNGHGTDPGAITVDSNVVSASLSPDGVSAAYVAGSGEGWAVRTVCDGCLARTLLSGRGPAPDPPMWSPDAIHIAVTQGGTVTVTAVGTVGAETHWTLPNRAVVLGWDHSGRGLLLWNGATHRVQVHDLTGRRTQVWPGVYMHRPSLSPDGRAIARTRAGTVWIRVRNGRWLALRGTRGCSPGRWSGNGKSLLVSCSGRVQMRSAAGRLIAQATTVPASAFWAPDSVRALLYFSQGTLWRWEVGSGPTPIVPHAHSPQ